MKLAFCMDIHLNFLLHKGSSFKFGEQVKASGADLVVLTGDIEEAPGLAGSLLAFAEGADMPVVFVLGNHDYYYSSIAYMREKMIRVAADPSNQLTYLTSTGVMKLTDRAALIGHDGWYDGEFGDFWHSTLLMSDFAIIGEFRNVLVDGQGRVEVKGEFRFNEGLRHHWKPIMERLALESAKHIGTNARQAVKDGYKEVFIATHVPPFEEAHLAPNRKRGNANWAPFFTNKVLGETLMEIAGENPDVTFRVLCGHTHTAIVHHSAHNLITHVGDADYGRPIIQTPLFNITDTTVEKT